jgi:hypothetical protein
MAPPLLPHILEISQANGKPWVNPAFDTSDPNWASNVVGGQTFDGSSQHPFEWVSVLNPKVEQDDQVGLSGTVIEWDDSANDLPFTHPFGNDYEFTIAPDNAYTSLLAHANRDPNGVDSYKESWQLAGGFGLNPPGVLGLEVDGALVPAEDRVQAGDRVAVFGRWIVDAGHKEFHSEIHPPLLMARARCVDGLGNSVAPTLDAITHVQFWSRPYQSAQLFSTRASFADGLVDDAEGAYDAVKGWLGFGGGHQTPKDTGLCLSDYVNRIVGGWGSVEAYPPVHAKPFAGVHVVAFTVRPPMPQFPVSGAAHLPPRQLECSYHFTVNGSCGVEVSASLAGPNAVLVVFALSEAGYPKLPQPKSIMKQWSISALLDEAKRLGEKLSWDQDAFISLKEVETTDHIGFRIFNPPAISPLDSNNVVPFTQLGRLPMSQHVTDLHQAFPVRGWLKLAWVEPTATTAGGKITTVFELAGSWSAGGKPGPKITRSGNALTVDMSAYHRPPAHGSVIDPQTIVVTFSDVSSVTGRLSAPGTIAWSNKSSWTKS